MKKEEEKYKYNAFISYRHTDLDRFVAENLHKLIETYKMPEPVVEKYHITDNNVRRIFRDQEELPLCTNLEDPIIDSLKKSEFLIVICSPRIKESMWCRKEIETFIKFHGRNNVLCVLIEGEPADSFPEEVMKHKEKVRNKDGKLVTKTVHSEPLAMDVRGANQKEVYKRMKSEIVRIMAPLYKLDYDDIKRRHEERELQRKNRIFKTIAAASLAFAVYSFALFSRIAISSKQLKYDQSINVANEAHELLRKDDRVGAVEKAYQSITKYEGVKMPKTSKGLYELTDSLGVYYFGDYFYPISQLDTLGVVKHMKIDYYRRYLLSYDESGELVLWDIEKEKRMKTITDSKEDSYGMEPDNYTFIGKDYYAYINKDKSILVYDYKGNEKAKIDIPIPLNASLKILGSNNGKYFVISCDNFVNEGKILVYDAETFKLISTYDIPKDNEVIDNIYFDKNEENVVFSYMKRTYDSDYNGLTVAFYNIKDKKIINKKFIDAHKVVKIIFNGDESIILSNKNKNDVRFGTVMILTRYNYKNNKTFYQREYNDDDGTNMEMTSDEDGTKTILVGAWDFAYIFDYETGTEKLRFSLESSEAGIHTCDTCGIYRLFTSKGTVHVLSNDFGSRYQDISIVGYYNFGLSGYDEFLLVRTAILAHAGSNRIIIYDHIENKDVKETKYEKRKFKELDSKEKKEIIKEYDFKLKNLIDYIFYSDDKKELFVVYKGKSMEVYNTKNKKLLKRLDKLDRGVYDHYIAKTEDGEHVIAAGEGGYLLNKNYEIIAYIPALVDYKDGKFILYGFDKKYYEIKKYSEKEIIKKGKEYLKEKGRLK